MSTLVIDTIQGKTTAGSVNVRGEGSNNTNLQQGLIKFFVTYTENSTTATFSSFNFSSLTDNGTGQTNHSFTNNFAANKEYAVVGGGCSNAAYTTTFTAGPEKDSVILTSSVEIDTKYVYSGGYNYTDLYYVSVACAGDLA